MTPAEATGLSRAGRLAVWTASALLAAACTGGASDPVSSGDTDGDSTSTAETTTGPVGGGADGSGDGVDGGSGVATLSIDDALAADPGCPDPVAGTPLKIGYGADFSALGAPADVPGSEAATHFADLINCSGGVDGRPVEVRVVDISGGPLAGRKAIAELIAWGPDAIIGPRLTGPGLRLLEATGGRLAVVFAISSEPALADPSRGSFLVATDELATGEAAARFALDQTWLTAATVTAPGPDFGSAAAAFASAFSAGGGVGVTEFSISADQVTGPTQEGFSEIVDQLALGPAPDVIYASLPPTSFAVLHRTALDAGVESEFINGDVLALADVDAAADPLVTDLDGSYAIGQLAPPGDSRMLAFDESFATTSGSRSTNPTAAALAGDAMAVIIEAALLTDRPGPDGIVRALRVGLVAEGVSGTLVYAGEGSPSRALQVLRVADGRVASVATIEP